MERALEIINEMIRKVDKEIDENRKRFEKTNPNNIYDQDYRKMLLDIHARNMNKYMTLCDVKRAFEDEIAKDFSEGFDK